MTTSSTPKKKAKIIPSPTKPHSRSTQAKKNLSTPSVKPVKKTKEQTKAKYTHSQLRRSNRLPLKSIFSNTSDAPLQLNDSSSSDRANFSHHSSETNVNESDKASSHFSSYEYETVPSNDENEDSIIPECQTLIVIPPFTLPETIVLACSFQDSLLGLDFSFLTQASQSQTSIPSLPSETAVPSKINL